LPRDGLAESGQDALELSLPEAITPLRPARVRVAP
jgi:hypothetical protein